MRVKAALFSERLCLSGTLELSPAIGGEAVGMGCAIFSIEIVNHAQMLGRNEGGQCPSLVEDH